MKTVFTINVTFNGETLPIEKIEGLKIVIPYCLIKAHRHPKAFVKERLLEASIDFKRPYIGYFDPVAETIIVKQGYNWTLPESKTVKQYHDEANKEFERFFAGLDPKTWAQFQENEITEMKKKLVFYEDLEKILKEKDLLDYDIDEESSDTIQTKETPMGDN